MSLKEKLLSLDVFEDNEYLDKYCELIENNKNTKKEKFKTNKHHIIPRCYYKYNNLNVDDSKDNLVNLLWCDHMKAHYYLYKCSLGKLKMANAIALRYVETKYKLDITSILQNVEEYQIIQENISEYYSNSRKGKRNPHSLEWNKKISDSNKGKKLSEETKHKLSLLNKGKKLSGVALEHVRNADRTKQRLTKQTPEYREKARLHALGNRNKVGWKASQQTKLLQSLNNGKNIKILCIETNEIFYNVNSCSNKTGLTRQYIMLLVNTGKMCNARILKKYEDEVKIKLMFYKGKHFKKLEDD